MDKFLISKNFKRKFSTENNIKYDCSLELREKFSEICRADLISRVLEKRIKKDNLLLRSQVIITDFIGNEYSVYTGKVFARLLVKKEMVGFKVGEFILTKKNKKYKMNSLSFTPISKAEKRRRKKLIKARKLKLRTKALVFLNKLVI